MRLKDAWQYSDTKKIHVLNFSKGRSETPSVPGDIAIVGRQLPGPAPRGKSRPRRTAATAAAPFGPVLRPIPRISACLRLVRLQAESDEPYCCDLGRRRAADLRLRRTHRGASFSLDRPAAGVLSSPKAVSRLRFPRPPPSAPAEGLIPGRFVCLERLLISITRAKVHAQPTSRGGPRAARAGRHNVASAERRRPREEPYVEAPRFRVVVKRGSSSAVFCDEGAAL